MKFTALILFVTTVIASQVHDNHARAMLMDRSIDPSTMDPALLSLLIVLKTAMPSGTNVPLPTGTSEPDWYKHLPDNIKSSLYQYYPATTTSSSSSASTTSQTTLTVVSSSSQVSESVASTSMPAITSAPLLNITSMSSTILNSSTATSAPLSSASGFPSPSSNQSTTVTTPPLTSAPSSAPTSAGLKNAAHTGLLTTAVAWLSVAAGFCLLA